jgi:hypothetical protein
VGIEPSRRAVKMPVSHETCLCCSGFLTGLRFVAM